MHLKRLTARSRHFMLACGNYELYTYLAKHGIRTKERECYAGQHKNGRIASTSGDAWVSTVVRGRPMMVGDGGRLSPMSTVAHTTLGLVVPGHR